MKKMIMVLLMSAMLVGCSGNMTGKDLPVPGDYEFIGPLPPWHSK